MSPASIIKIAIDDPRPDLLDFAVKSLTSGGVIAFPTETVYGIGCLRSMGGSIKRIYDIKGRNWDKPLAVYLPDSDALMKEAEVTSYAGDLIRSFLPGPMTIILNNSKGQKTGCRVVPHPVVLALLKMLPEPMLGTSANKSGEPECLSATEVFNCLGDGLDLIIDSGCCESQVPSTVVDCTGPEPVVLREGAIPAKDIRDALGQK